MRGAEYVRSVGTNGTVDIVELDRIVRPLTHAPGRPSIPSSATGGMENIEDVRATAMGFVLGEMVAAGDFGDTGDYSTKQEIADYVVRNFANVAESGSDDGSNQYGSRKRQGSRTLSANVWLLQFAYGHPLP